MVGCKSYLPVFPIICYYFPVFPGKCHWHGPSTPIYYFIYYFIFLSSHPSIHSHTPSPIHPHTHLSTHPSILTLIHSHTYPSTHHLPICTPIYPPTHKHLSVYTLTHSSMHPHTHLSINTNPSIYLPSTHSSIHPHTHSLSKKLAGHYVFISCIHLLKLYSCLNSYMFSIVKRTKNHV